MEGRSRSASYLGACLRPGVDIELGKNALGVMPGSVSADSKGLRDRRVGAALRQKYCHFQLPCSKSVMDLKVGVPAALGGVSARAGLRGSVLLELVPKLAHLVERPANLIDQGLAVSSESGESRQQVYQAVAGHSR